jgi:hypothetical protein
MQDDPLKPVELAPGASLLLVVLQYRLENEPMCTAFDVVREIVRIMNLGKMTRKFSFDRPRSCHDVTC